MTDEELLEMYKSTLRDDSFVPVAGLVRLGYPHIPQWMIEYKGNLVMPASEDIKHFLFGTYPKIHEYAYTLLENDQVEYHWSALEEEAVVNDVAYEVNKLRREMGFDISDRVTIHLNKCGWDIGYAVCTHLKNLLKRTISVDVVFNSSTEGKEIKVGGRTQDTSVLLKLT